MGAFLSWGYVRPGTRSKRYTTVIGECQRNVAGRLSMVCRDYSDLGRSGEVVVTREIGVSGGRRVAFDCWGDPKGFPVFLLHGTPGSRSGPVPRVPLLYQLGVQLISYDRPGYGGSDRHQGRTVTAAAWDVLDIADHLALDTFGVVGRSGGGPHALACAAFIGGNRLR